MGGSTTQFLDGRGIALVSTIAEAVEDRKAMISDVDALVDAITPAIGRAMAQRLREAVNAVVAAVELEVLSRLIVVMEAVLGGGAGQVFVAPKPGEDDA